MAFISEIHYKDSVEDSTNVSEYVEVSLTPDEVADAANFTISVYEQDGNLNEEVVLSTLPSVLDTTSGLFVYTFEVVTTDPDNNSTSSSEAIALVDTSTTPNTVITFVDIGRGEKEILALDGAAAGARSENIAASTEQSIQFDQAGNRIDGDLTVGMTVACFTDTTLISTTDGLIAIEHLKIGDLVETIDAGAQPIRWIGSRTVSLCEMLAEPKLCPIVIPTSQGAPLRVSRQHRLLISGEIAQRMFGQNEILVPAKDLVGYNGITVAEIPADVTYFHILLDAHHIINANGLAAESLYLGAEGIKAMTPAARDELAAILPQLANHETFVAGDMCRAEQSGRKVQNFARRSQKNGRQLVVSF